LRRHFRVSGRLRIAVRPHRAARTPAIDLSSLAVATRAAPPDRPDRIGTAAMQGAAATEPDKQAVSSRAGAQNKHRTLLLAWQENVVFSIGSPTNCQASLTLVGEGSSAVTRTFLAAGPRLRRREEYLARPGDQSVTIRYALDLDGATA
jgi:hypothetical protein